MVIEDDVREEVLVGMYPSNPVSIGLLRMDAPLEAIQGMTRADMYAAVPWSYVNVI